MAMKNKNKLSFCLSLMMGTSAWLSSPMYALGQALSASSLNQSNVSQQTLSELKGSWSGTFFSTQASFPPFSLTVIINPNSKGHLTGSASLNSECLKGTKLDVTVNGSSVVLAGSDEEGDSLTLRGSLDSSGSVIDANYILNGSASGRCETDAGSGILAKR